MDLYHSWFYVNILNSKWFVWSMVYLILGFNVLAPIIVWFVMSGKKIPFWGSKNNGNSAN
ncbi:hypothetical protein EIZ39_12305 [Ammoniphilus sp. CFH 90114]|nr:hypothetical protein EIZ39_12305 [Ammoniphilus sp. CFH 90114]